jgi:hypothetical protein
VPPCATLRCSLKDSAGPAPLAGMRAHRVFPHQWNVLDLDLGEAPFAFRSIVHLAVQLVLALHRQVPWPFSAFPLTSPRFQPSWADPRMEPGVIYNYGEL